MSKKKPQKPVVKPAKKRVRKAKPLKVPVAEALPTQAAPPDLAPAVMSTVHSLPPAAESVTVTPTKTVDPVEVPYHAEVIDSGTPVHSRLLDCEEAEVVEQAPRPGPWRITHSGDVQPLPWWWIIAVVIAALLLLAFASLCSQARGDVAVSVGPGAVSVDAGKTSVGIGWHPRHPPVPLWKPEPWRKPLPPATPQHRRPHHRHGGLRG